MVDTPIDGTVTKYRTAMLPTHLKPGMVFGQDYEILERLASGGMGTVYVALQQSTGKRRALKVMHAQYEGDEHARRRFIQEAKVGAAIDSDHIVEMVGAGVDPETNVPWIAMELLKGADLKTVMTERKRLPPEEVLEIFRQVCHALGRAHTMGLVHRDLKPENIFLAVPRREGVAFTAKLLDFGIAKLLRDNTGNHTQTQAIGSPRWMAPEQADRGGAIAASTDVWALGLIAFYLLTGEIFWKTAHLEAPSIIGQMCEVLMDPIPPASERAAEYGVASYLPQGFDAWFARCVVRDQAQRFTDANEALAALEDVLGDVLPAAPLLRRPTPARGLSSRPPAPTPSNAASPRPPAPSVGYTLEAPPAKSDPAFVFDATAVGPPSGGQLLSLPPPTDKAPPSLVRRAGPFLLAVLGPVGIAVAVFMGIQRTPVGIPPPGADASMAARAPLPAPRDRAPLHGAHPATEASTALRTHPMEFRGPDAQTTPSPDTSGSATHSPTPDVLQRLAPDLPAPTDTAPSHASPLPDVPGRDARSDVRVARPRGDGPSDLDGGEAAPNGIVEPASALYMRQVSSLMRTQHPAFLRCYQDHTPPATEPVRVSITFHYTLQSDGSVRTVSVRGAPQAVNDCVAEVIRAMRFPTPVVVTSPILDELHFSSQ
jgi:serine/threonine protein kinase